MYRFSARCAVATLTQLFLASLLLIEATAAVRIIIDTDGVTDDIRAISLALQNKNTEVMAITTVRGGVNASQSAANVARTLRANKRYVPIYKGAEDALFPRGPLLEADPMFGSDGIGDTPKTAPEALPRDWLQHEAESAAEALVRLTAECDDVVLVCLGPLTNIALALRLDPNFATRPKKIVIMGGNYYGVGNTLANSSAEFNFWNDPEAAQMVLTEMRSPIVMVPWEAFFFDGPKYSKIIDFTRHLKFDSPLSKFLFNCTQIVRNHLAKTSTPYSFMDDIAVAVAIDPSIALTSSSFYVDVELENSYTRGQVVVDWLNVIYNETTQGFNAIPGLKTGWPMHSFVTSYNVRRVNDIICEEFSKGGR
ncbi:unnamed protein product [Caenorhabditis auriculariae]|uniref:Inosine/uridine-preferring nucleoside hydrolase domain-containing protein n=1 Tax=Caenorhabditis auriculariae TaxID=2777116 RepID=A0A8S1HFA5_9PELO|nr:unnamed protein product [Caenorhabditis auriculariae]